MTIDKTILVYDDEDDILELVQRALRKQYRVFTRNYLANVLEDVQLIQPTVILFDYHVKGMVSEESIIQLKQSFNTRHIPVVLFTAHDNIELIARMLKADAFLQKPFSLKDLRTCLARFNGQPVTQKL